MNAPTQLLANFSPPSKGAGVFRIKVPLARVDIADVTPRLSSGSRSAS